MDLEILKADHIKYSSKNRLEVFDKRGILAEITDFGCLLYDTNIDLKDEKKEVAYRLQDNYPAGLGLDCATLLKVPNFADLYPSFYRDGTPVRPVLPYSCVKDLVQDKQVVINRADDEVLEVLFGAYPQTVAIDCLQTKLESLYQRGKLKTSIFKYTVNDYVSGNKYPFTFKPVELYEYEYNNKKYVRVGYKQFLNTKFVWFKVEPIKWWVDEKQDIMVTEKCIIAGIPYADKNHFRQIQFSESTINMFFKTYFAKEIIQHNLYEFLENDAEVLENYNRLLQLVEHMSYKDKKTFLRSFLELKSSNKRVFKKLLKFIKEDLLIDFNNLEKREYDVKILKLISKK